MSEYKKKLIEVALPLEAINRESAREKQPFTRHHPRSIHVWWARRPLAACRAVLFAQLVDDPSAHPEQFPTDESQAIERQRLFDIIERLVVWENVNDEALLREARAEILKSTDGNPPVILDPFAGGGSIPVEAQRLGLIAEASDLNPVAVLINKALIEIPPIWAGRPPISPGAAETKMTWSQASGLAEDVRQYGRWFLNQTEERIGHLYPMATLPDGSKAVVAAWIWARTITCPNPACGIQMPLVRSWWLGKRKGKEAYAVPSITNGEVHYTIGHDPKSAPRGAADGTVSRTGANCIACETAVPLVHVRAEGQAGRIAEQLVAVVAFADRQRHYLPGTTLHEAVLPLQVPSEVSEALLPEAALGFRVQAYGMSRFADLFTVRQLNALSAMSQLLVDLHQRVLDDAKLAGLRSDGPGLEEHGSGAHAYADAIVVYLALAVARYVDLCNSLVSWNSTNENARALFSRHAIPMVWDFAEVNPFGRLGIVGFLETAPDLLERMSTGQPGLANQQDASSRSYEGVLVSTDPPYYDNIGYANLADFFYGWLRLPLGAILPQLFSTVQTPKADELVAEPFRHGGRQVASDFFEQGFNDVFGRIRESTPNDFPITVFYAFKQNESDESGVASTGWQTLLEGMLGAGWEVTATWPMRTERVERSVGLGTNALASSILLALRPRPTSAQTIGRRAFVQALQSELPVRLKELQQGSVAPVDLAQAAIGPGMAVFSRYARVLEADGSEMTVRTALALINQSLDTVLAEQEGDFDAETRFAVKWFSQYGWNEAPSGEADVLTRATNTTVSMLERGGIFRAAAGKARLIEPSNMSGEWSPSDDKAISVWEVAVRLGHALITEGTEQASTWMREAASRVDLNAVKELSYLMYSVCERKGWTEAALLFNALGTSWSDIAGVARVAPGPVSKQSSLDFGDDDE